MHATTDAGLLVDQAEIRQTVQELRGQALLWAVPVPFVAGFVLLFGIGDFHHPLQGVVLGASLYLLTAVVWSVQRWNGFAASCVLVTGCMSVDVFLLTWGGVGAAILLMSLPVGLATLLIGARGGALAATACTLFLLTPNEWLRLDGTVRVTTILNVWGTVGLVGLASRPLLTTLQWSWSSYERSRALLEQARDTQAELKQTLQDLVEANSQLTRLNRVAHALRQAAEDARRAKQQFAANISHELRTPLNMIVGFTEMIMTAPKSYGDIPPALLADLDVILRNSQHLASLISDVLDLSQLDAGQTTLLKERVAFTELVEAAATAVRPLYASKGLHLQTEMQDDLVVFCDRTRIREVLLNLLINAGRFTERGGVRVRVCQDENDAVISVADTGPGIATEDQDQVFEPFRQLDSSLRRRDGGVGLGLSISKSFVELHGGKMWLTSEKGCGATFFFSLPVDPPAPLESGLARWLDPSWEYKQRSRRSRLPPTIVRPRVVVLEAGRALQRLVSRHLGEIEVVPVTSLEEAAQELTRVPAKALLINAPSVGEALQRLNSAGCLPNHTPSFVCSVPGPHEAARVLGVADYLVKPISRSELLAAVERLTFRGKTVLIVDDEPDAQRLFRRMLISADQDYRVLRATDGRHAMSILREEHPDLVLLDLVMPEVDGFQLLAEKSANPSSMWPSST
ncbi:MAG: response regulator [Chloroflexi bacterium]|nr:response regulator [Chloroflexota bacterium]